MPYQPDPDAPVDERKCTVMTKSSNRKERCGQWAVKGTKVCKVHGGLAPQVREAGRRRVAEQKATRAAEKKASAVLAHEGVRPVEDPLEELGRLASSSREFMLALGQRVNALNKIDHADLKDALQARVEVELYERAMDRTARLLDKLVQHGYTERQVQIAETEAMMVAGVVKRTIAALGLTKEQQALAQKQLAAEFRQMRPISLANNDALERHPA